MSGAVSHNLAFWAPAGKCHLLCAHWHKALQKGMTENFLLEHEWVRKASADLPVASSSCQACTSFFSNAITLTLHVQVTLNTWWAISKSQLVPSPWLFPRSPVLHCRPFDFYNNLLNCFKYCAAVSSICSLLTVVWPPLFTILAMVKLMSKMAKALPHTPAELFIFPLFIIL